MHILGFFLSYDYIPWVCSSSKLWVIMVFLFIQPLLWKQTKAVLLYLLSSEMCSQCSSHTLNVTSIKLFPYGCFHPLLLQAVFYIGHVLFLLLTQLWILQILTLFHHDKICFFKRRNKAGTISMKCPIPVKICLFVNTCGLEWCGATAVYALPLSKLILEIWWVSSFPPASQVSLWCRLLRCQCLILDSW